MARRMVSASGVPCSAFNAFSPASRSSEMNSETRRTSPSIYACRHHCQEAINYSSPIRSTVPMSVFCTWCMRRVVAEVAGVLVNVNRVRTDRFYRRNGSGQS